MKICEGIHLTHNNGVSKTLGIHMEINISISIEETCGSAEFDIGYPIDLGLTQQGYYIGLNFNDYIVLNDIINLMEENRLPIGNIPPQYRNQRYKDTHIEKVLTSYIFSRS